MKQWIESTRKPRGAIGLTLQSPSATTAALPRTASFLFTRETLSLQHLADAGVAVPRQGFAADASRGGRQRSSGPPKPNRPMSDATQQNTSCTSG